MISVSIRRATGLLGLFIFLFSNQIIQIDGLVMLPEVKNNQQVIREGSTLTLTCIEKIYLGNSIELIWTNSKIQTHYERWETRVNINTLRNETHLISAMTLTNIRAEDTGFYYCHGIRGKEGRYVFVSSHTTLVLKKYSSDFELYLLNRDLSQLGFFYIPFTITHPNISVSVFKQTRETGVEPQNEYSKVFNSSSRTENSRWSFDPTKGLTLRNPTTWDSSVYYIVSYLPFVNGKRVNIKHDKNTKEFLSCIFGQNELDSTDVNRVAVVVEGIEMERMGAPDDPVEGSNVTLVCSSFNFFDLPPIWFYYENDKYHPLTSKEINGNVQEATLPEILLKQSNTDGRIILCSTCDSYQYSIVIEISIKVGKKWKFPYFYKSQLSLHNVTLQAPTTFICLTVQFADQLITERNISFTIKEINNDPVFNTLALEKGLAQNLSCNRLSDNVRIHWLKDGKQYLDTVYENKISSILPLKGKAREMGTYECRWNNSRGEARHRNFTVSVTFAGETNAIHVMTTTSTLIGLLAIGLGIGIKFYLDKKKLEKDLAEMLDGDPSRIDPNVPVDHQTEFLSYDKKWEFPRKRLRLGEELGAGRFGRVVKAEAVGINNSDETVATVAVKMIRRPSDKTLDALNVLIRELKIMIYLGQHLNVVNLMGACTKTNIKEEISIIIEFCRFGNLKSYLIKNRNQFINQLNVLGNILPENETMNVHTPENQQVANDSTEHPLSGAKEFAELKTHVTKMPEQASQYGNDPYATSIQITKTRDLISWSYQIARGMEFLASKKVLHGDLAARNVLLADHGIVKVADFGMSRQMRNYDYQKNGEELLPVKWMAIESLTDNSFSSQSDVWSYGIVLWEIFSLGNIPYPGIENGYALVREIRNGHRMEKPEYSPNFFGEMMKNCWKVDPKERPTFSKLAEVTGEYIKTLVSFDYLNANEPENQNGLIGEKEVDSTLNEFLANC